MNFARRSKGISGTASIAVIVIVVIIAAAGWSAYAAFPLKTTVTSVSTVTGAGGSGATTQTVTQTITQTASGGSAGNSTPTFLTPTTSSDSFTIATLAGVNVFADLGFAQQIGTISQYVPNAKVTTFSTGGQLTSALGNGQVQLEVLDGSSPIPAIEQGSPIEIVANLLPVPTPWGIYVLANSTYKTLADLHGKAFGVTSPGAVTAFITQYVLAKTLGWQVNKDYTLAAEGGFAAENAAMNAGTLPAQAEGASLEYQELLSGQYRSIYNFTLGYPSVSLLAYTPFVQQHPNAVRATLEALLKANYVWDTNSSLAISYLETTYKLVPSSAQYTYTTLPYSIDGAISLSRNQQAVNFLMLGGAITSNITVTKFISTEFVPIIP